MNCKINPSNENFGRYEKGKWVDEKLPGWFDEESIKYLEMRSLITEIRNLIGG